MNSLEELKNKLRELFQFDRSDLDFGIYRIMNQKKEEVEKFLDQDLIPQVKKEFDQYKSNEKVALSKELEEAIKQAKSLGMDPDQAPKVKELKDRVSQSLDISALENEVYSYLYNFFARYYDKGDFISLRRYKKDTYSIPYEGEEVKLYWANHDQYYIKSSENFKNYRFKLSNGKSINFNLAEATSEKNNNKTQNGKERRFFLAQENITEIIGDELMINFIYDLNDEKQEILKDQAVTKIIEIIKSNAENYKEFYEILSLKPTEKDKNRTLLEKHLNDYVAKNTFDYFIHKDLGNFLRRELDFFIKNEVLFIDDLDTENERKFDAQISTVKVIKKIGHKIIAFLEQLENFQKKLWLKKKFVYGTNYCMTLDYIPEEFYAEIAGNKDQINEWIKLFAINEIKADQIKPGFDDSFNADGTIKDQQKAVEFLKINKLLVLDTKFLIEVTKDKILASIDNIDEKTNGLLINSDNFHALNLLKTSYGSKVNCVYIDPPYNAKSSEIMYKNGFKHSSWMTLIENRVKVSYKLLESGSFFNFAIDDYEERVSTKLLEQIFGEENFISNICVMHNPRGRNDDKFFGTSHEYMTVFAKDKPYAELGLFDLTSEDEAAYNKTDSISNYSLVSYMRTGNNSRRFERPNLFYEIYVKAEDGDMSLTPKEGYTKTLPISATGEEKTWRWGQETFLQKYKTELLAKIDDNGKVRIYKKRRLEGAGKKPKTIWAGSRYDASSHGIMLLRSMFGTVDAFSYPKSINTVYDALSIMTEPGSVVLDYFAGSGTTAHAIINLNRQAAGEDKDYPRKFILVEMGEYCDSMTKPRIVKAIYSSQWKEGKPLDRSGLKAQIVKYFSSEQYEDSLENLNLKRNEAMTLALGDSTRMREDYTLNYMLDIESKESDSLLNLEKFEDPFNYKMKIIKDNEITWEKMDLVETFNYLIGLTVDKIDTIRGFKTISGNLPDGQRALVIWRNLREKSNADLDEFCKKQLYTTQDSEFDVIYVNGDNNLINVEDDEKQRFKVVLVEDEFKKRMFESEEV